MPRCLPYEVRVLTDDRFFGCRGVTASTWRAINMEGIEYQISHATYSPSISLSLTGSSMLYAMRICTLALV